MKVTYFITLYIILVSVVSAEASNIRPFYNAINPPNNIVKPKDILNAYSPSKGNTSDTKSSIEELLAKSSTSSSPNVNYNPSPAASPAGMSNLGADLASNLIFAAGSLMLERAKAEIALEYFGELKKKFDADIIFTYREGCTKKTKLKDVFPSVYTLIEKADVEILSPNVGNAFVKSIETDFMTFPYKFDKFMAADCIKDNLEYNLFKIMYYAIMELRKGENPSNVLASLALMYPLPIKENDTVKYTPLQNLQLSIQIVYSISEAFRDTTINNFAFKQWISEYDFNKLSGEQKHYFIAFLYATAPEAFEYFGFTAEFLGNKNSVQYKNLLSIINQASNLLTGIQSIIKKKNDIQSYNPSDTVNNKIDQFRQYSSLFLKLFSLVTATDRKFKSEPTFRNKLEEFERYSEKVIEIVIDGSQKNYSGVMFKTIDVIREINENEKLSIPNEIFKYGGLICDIAAAKTEAECKAVLDAAIMPVGSYKAKRNCKYALLINSYAGIGYGAEKVIDASSLENSFKQDFAPVGLIGLDFCFSLGKSHSGSLFFSILDLGSVLNYRLDETKKTNTTNDTVSSVKQLPEITFGQVFSPGVFFIWGAFGSPLAIGSGIQFTPELRKIETSTNSAITATTQKSVFRWSIFISVDIPFFTLSMKQ